MTPAEEIKALLDQQATAFNAFKAENDKRLKDNSAAATANVEALNNKLTDLADQLKAAQKRSDDHEKRMNRIALGGGGAGAENELADAITATAFARLRNVAAFTAEDVRNYRKAQDTYWRKGQATPADLMNTLSVGSDPDGGYWVLPDTTGRIVQKIYDMSIMRKLASVQVIGTDALEGPIDNGEAGAGWVGEQSPRPVTGTPQVGKWRIPVHEMYAQPQATQQLLDDANVDVEAWLGGKIANKMSRLEGAAFVNGNGSGKPRGFLDRTAVATADATRTWGQIQYVPTGASGAFDATIKGDALIDLIYALKAEYRQGASFLMSRTSVAAVRKLKDGQGNYLWAPGSAGQPATLMGYPVEEDENMPAIAANSLSIAFGNWKEGYQIVDRQGVRVLRDPFSSKPYVLFYTTKRVGGDVLNSEAIKLLKFAAS